MTVTVAETGTAGAAGAAESTGRESRFSEAIGQLRTRVTAATAHRWFRLAGPVLMPLGALAVVLGWWGAANTTRVFLQIPYLISGGLLGLGLMFVGGFVYFARWLTDLLEAIRAETARAERADERTTEALERIETLLEATALGGNGSAAPVVQTSELVATEHGKLTHVRSCRLVAGRDTITLDPEEAAARAPCRICEPELPST